MTKKSFKATDPGAIEPFLDVILPATYTGNRNDQNKILSCVSTQLDSFGNILYTSRSDLSLDIQAPADVGGLAIPVGGIVGILLAILLLFLLCAILAFFLYRRDRKERYGVDNQIIAASKGGYTSVPVEHDIHVTGGDDLEKNYDVNINQIYNDRFGKTESINVIENNKLQKTSENLEDYLVAGLARRDSSSSSSSSDKSKLIKTETDSGISERNENFTNYYWSNTNVINKTDSTFIYNGKTYEEEVFEDHLLMPKSKFPMPSKFRPKRWTNNLSEIREGDHDDEVQILKHDNHANIVSVQVEQETGRKTINDCEKETQNSYHDTRNTNTEEKTYSSKDVSVELINFNYNQKNITSEDISTVRKDSKDKKEKKKKKKKTITESVSNRVSHDTSAEILKKKNDQIFVEIGNTSGSRSSCNIIGHLDLSKASQETEYVKQDIQIQSDGSSDKSKYTFRDDHYYIGDSEYAEVVEEHVQGKYEDDIEYCEEKLKHTVDVKPKIWTLKDIKIEESRIQRTSTMRDPKVLPPPGLSTESKKEYIVNWISTENLQVSPTSDKSCFQEEASVSSLDQELDRSDESCIVEAEQRTKGQSSGARYQHITDYINMKEKIQPQISGEDKKVDRNSSISNRVSNVDKKTEKSSAEIMNAYSPGLAAFSETKSSESSRSTARQVSFSGGKTPRSILKNQSADSLQTDKNSKMYKITQQEIVFYLKNKEGIVKVVRRPLLHTKNFSKIPSEERENSFIRHKSQPNLYSSHILRHLDESGQELASGLELSSRDDGSQHIHMKSVGLLQHSLSLKQVNLKDIFLGLILTIYNYFTVERTLG